MSKLEKNKIKIVERIKELEAELILSLTKKTSTTKEIDAPLYTRKIEDLKSQLKAL